MIIIIIVYYCNARKNANIISQQHTYYTQYVM